MTKELSADTLEFIRSSFTSVWALELIFLMRRDRARGWSVADLTRELRASERLIAGILRGFIAQGLVFETARNVFQYGAAAPEIERLVDRVAAAYAQNRFKVINAIFRAENENVRSFADAFKIKKD